MESIAKIPELEALAGEAAQADIEAGQSPGATDQEEGHKTTITTSIEVSGDEVAELSGLLCMVAGLFAPLLPRVASIYTPETCAVLAAATLPVMRKHGWSVPGMLSKWGDEFALAVVVLPLGVATYKAAKEDFAAAEKYPAPGEKVDILAAPEKAENNKPEPVYAERG